MWHYLYLNNGPKIGLTVIQSSLKMIGFYNFCDFKVKWFTIWPHFSLLRKPFGILAFLYSYCCDSTKGVNRKYIMLYCLKVASLYVDIVSQCSGTEITTICLDNSLTAELIRHFCWYFTQVWLAWRQAEPCWLLQLLAQTSTKFALAKTLSQSLWPS